MKLRPDMKLEQVTMRRQDSGASAEEFVKLPRSEFLLPDGRGDISASVTNDAISCRDRFSLRVEDNRMAGAGISRGDLVVVQTGRKLRDGEVVLVRVGHRLMIRRCYSTGGRVRLECDTPGRQTMIIHRDTPGFSVVGHIIQVIREL